MWVYLRAISETSHSSWCLIGKKETVRETSALRVSGREDSKGRDWSGVPGTGRSCGGQRQRIGKKARGDEGKWRKLDKALKRMVRKLEFILKAK